MTDTHLNSLRKNKLQHAEHNYSACMYLKQSKEFPDWIITTAFYSALHYFESLIFPYKESSVEYKSTEEFFQNNKLKYKLENIHSARLHLVKTCYPEYKNAYKDLLGISKTARYNDYKAYDMNDADRKIQNLNRIKQFVLSQFATQKP
ncbi:MAG: hypothetical protein ACD_79C01466G0005 [uncultured bacterium]|nr:MAG: hypothetical protein ACD_79C01466G0005 [uncultured bacterium]